MNSEHHLDKVVDHVPYCSCGQASIYYSSYDSFACKVGDVWLDNDANVTDYMFDTERPGKPSEGF